MFDTDTGTITFDDPLVVVSPSLRRSVFLESELAINARTLVENEPWHSWSLNGRFRLGLSFTMSLFFKGEDLTMIDLCDTNPAFPTDWNNWSQDGELARKASHDKWIEEYVGTRRSFAWGRVASCFDQKGGWSHLMIQYEGWGT